MTILYIDDDVEDYELFCEAARLACSNLHILHASGGRQAIDMLKFSPALPDYIFLDIAMPVMDGEETLSCLKSHADLSSIPVIIYSGIFDPTIRARIEHMGVQSFICKPSAIDDLISILRATVCFSG